MDSFQNELCYSVLRSLFDVSDSNRTGLIHISQLAALLTKLGKNTGKKFVCSVQLVSTLSIPRFDRVFLSNTDRL
jgi:hypothetical protein